MSNQPGKGEKRKIEECDDAENDEDRVTKGIKKDLPSSGTLCSGKNLVLLKLTPEDLRHATGETDEVEEQNDESICEDTEKSRFSRGTSWTKPTLNEQNKLTSQVSIASTRFPSESSFFDCETQTYHFIPEPRRDSVEHEDESGLKDEEKQSAENKNNQLVSLCCVAGCKSQSSESDLSINYYVVPSNETERSLWAEILGVSFNEDSEGEKLEICSKHFIEGANKPKPVRSLPSLKSTPVKSRGRKKRTCDVLIAEEAEKVKQTMVTGRAKRTPKPNRNYDWAELTPLIKHETDGDDLGETAMPGPKIPVRHLGTQGKRGKMLVDIKKEKEDFEVPYISVSFGMQDEAILIEAEAEDYGLDISLPSEPRPPPPKPKGRPPRIRDTCAQTDDWASSKGSLREVKVQCNLTAEPMVSCASCSSIDWVKLEEQISGCLALEGDFCNPIIAKHLKKILREVTKPSHAANVLKMIAGVERDVLDAAKDIVLVSSQDDLEEVEIENVIHQEEAPITGVKEIIPKMWKKNKNVKKVRIKPEPVDINDPDSLGLREATDKDDDEFQPDFAAIDEEEDDDDDELKEMEEEEDEDWNIKNEDESGLSTPKKKKARQKSKKEHILEIGSGQGSSSSANDRKEVCDKVSVQQSRRRRRNDGDTRWLRQEHRCTECDKVFTTQRKYDLHYSHVHLGIAPWQGSHKCNDCEKTFTQKVSLNVHRMFKHGAPRRYQCGKCNYEGPTKEYMKRHMKVHTGERQFVCQECGKGLKSAESYRNHMVLHTNEGRFFCELCKKAFNHKGAFRDHMHSHKASRDFACNDCGAAFKAYKHVARHIRAVHLNDKRFICDICGTQHMTKFNLKNHLKKHGDLPFLSYSYQCPGCEAKFRGLQGLSAHLRVIHNVQPSEKRAEEGAETPIVTPHPTRRPMKYEYSRVSSGILSSDAVMSQKTEDVSKTIFVESDDLNVAYCKTEVAEDSCEMDVKEGQNQDFLVISSGGGECVIHVFSCTQCSLMFTSENLREEHMTEAHS